MNEKFFELSKEKQQRIINAGLEVFGKNEYKRAVTDDIAVKAGISKGLLFYYFHNKKSFYLYIYHYCIELLKSKVLDEDLNKVTDFFELLDYGASKKMEILAMHPYINEFVMRAFYTQNEELVDTINKNTMDGIEEAFTLYFAHVDFSKFKENVDPKEVYHMLVWMAEGFLHEKRNLGGALDLDMIMEEYYKWKELFRTMTYKEEWL